MFKIPIFIIVHNHLEILKKSLASYEKFIDYPKEFVFHNANSQYQPTLDFLESRENQGDIVHHSSSDWGVPYRKRFGQKQKGPNVMDTIRKYLSQNPDVKYYILTDPDIELNNVRGNIVETFIYILNKYKLYSVGPSLKIDDIPDYYPPKDYILSKSRHKSFHNSRRIKENFEGQEFEITKAHIDTTFQLIRSSSIDGKFPHRNCMRVFKPYDARHLDWYIDPDNMTDCQKFYSDNATSVSHWNNPKWA